MAEPRAPRRLPLENNELMSEGEDLHLEIEARPKTRPEGGEQSAAHAVRLAENAICRVLPASLRNPPVAANYAAAVAAASVSR